MQCAADIVLSFTRLIKCGDKIAFISLSKYNLLISKTYSEIPYHKNLTKYKYKNTTP
jgi:predicted Mrr-cat superfamily restriction endonuclease